MNKTNEDSHENLKGKPNTRKSGKQSGLGTGETLRC